MSFECLHVCLDEFLAGQHALKKLRRENEQLRREMWCLRDEYDKMEKLLRKKETDEDSNEVNIRCSIYRTSMPLKQFEKSREKKNLFFLIAGKF